MRIHVNYFHFPHTDFLSLQNMVAEGDNVESASVVASEKDKEVIVLIYYISVISTAYLLLMYEVCAILILACRLQVLLCANLGSL